MSIDPERLKQELHASAEVVYFAPASLRERTVQGWYLTAAQRALAGPFATERECEAARKGLRGTP